MAKLQKMVAAAVTAGGSNTAEDYYFKSNPLLYASISTETGIAPALADNKTVPHRVEDLLLGGVLARVAVTVGNTPATRRTIRLLCSVEKLASVETSLIGKAIPQGTITSVSADLKSQGYLA